MLPSVPLTRDEVSFVDLRELDMLHRVHESRHARANRDAESERHTERKGRRPLHIQPPCLLIRTFAISSSAFSSQNRMSISRYIVAATQGAAGLLVIAVMDGQPTEPEVAVRQERAHLERAGKRLRLEKAFLRDATFGGCAASAISACRRAPTPRTPALRASSGPHRLRCARRRVLHTADGEIGLAEVREARAP
jgi:hypothetical protein